MADIKKLAQRLKEFDDGQKANELSKLLWKPKEGPQTVRMVPYKFNPEVPFIELKFYYNLGGKHYLAPCTFGKPDPILEAIETLRSSGNSEDKLVAEKLAPTTRTYAPIIVRGQEELGVRFWGFGVQVFKQLLKVMTNPKYGHIESLSEGRDIDIEFKKIGSKRNAKGDPLPETSILVDPAITPAVDPKRTDLMDKLRDQTDILTIFPLKSYEELKDALNKWLNPDAASDDSTDPVEPAVIPEAAFSAPPTPAPTGEKIASEFADFFNKK